MVRRLVCVLFAAAVLAGSGAQARAAERTGSIRIELDYGEVREDRSEVVLYWVGSPSGEDYRLAESFGGGLIRGEDVQSPELAQWLAGLAGEAGTARILDADAAAEFSRLEEGLYLLVQTQAPEGYYCVAPFLIPLPYEDQWRIQANPKTQQILTESPKTGQHPAPIIAAMGMVLSGLGLVFCAEKLRKK